MDKVNVHRSAEKIVEFINGMIKDKIMNNHEDYLESIVMDIEVVTDADNIPAFVSPDLKNEESIFHKSDVKTFVEENLKVNYSFPKEIEYLEDIYIFGVKCIIRSDMNLRYGLLESFEIEENIIFHYYGRRIDITLLQDLYVEDYINRSSLPERELILELSAERYENCSSEAGIAFCDGSILNVIGFTVKFVTPYMMDKNNMRTIRKLMETVKDERNVLVAIEQNNSWKIIGIANRSDLSGCLRGFISFNGYMSWSFRRNDDELFKYYKGQYIVNVQPVSGDYGSQVDKVRKDYRDVIRQLLEYMKKQKHGTAAVIMNPTIAKQETERLCDKKKGIAIDKKKIDEWSEEVKIGLTNIDGAILVDSERCCHAIGVILDGPALVEGDSGRGARYNSIKNYVAWANRMYSDYFVGVIVSEDGMINVVDSDRVHVDSNVLSIADKAIDMCG